MHRVAQHHRRTLLGRAFVASSPNGRFTDGARAIDGSVLHKVEAVGKNLFYFFANPASVTARPKSVTATGTDEVADAASVVMHVHFGMSGRFGVWDLNTAEPVPEPTDTTRLKLVNEEEGIYALLSAMTVQHGGMDLFRKLRSKLGQDPLREDACFSTLWDLCGAPDAKFGRHSIGAVLMDQSKIAGVGNIYRAEICYKARVHPEQPCNTLGMRKFKEVWHHSVDLMQRGFLSGSIVTVDASDAAHAVDKQSARGRRRYIYNQSTCMMCGDAVVSWDMKARTCYACPTCQVLSEGCDEDRKQVASTAKPASVFMSSCARDYGGAGAPQLPAAKMYKRDIVAELRDVFGVAVGAGEAKAALAVKLESARASIGEKDPLGVDDLEKRYGKMASADVAAREKRIAGESANVEHVALNSSIRVDAGMRQRRPAPHVEASRSGTKRKR